MLSPLRNRFGIPGVISVIALVFAMMGGAYAAHDSSGGGGQATASAGNDNRANKRGKRNNRGRQGGLNAKQKRQVIALAKRFARQGPMGPQGVPGLPGAPGSDGDDGDDGDNGANGADGKSVVVGSFTGTDEEFGNPAGEPCELQGGNEIAVEGSSEVHYACNGSEGSPWTAGGTLPSGETETGAWAAAGSGITPATASFNIPLAAELDSEHAVVITESSSTADKEKCDNAEGAPASANNPEADPGYFCLFVGEFPGTVHNIQRPAMNGFGVGKTGAIIVVTPEFGQMGGSWAVTEKQ